MVNTSNLERLPRHCLGKLLLSILAQVRAGTLGMVIESGGKLIENIS